MARLKWTEQAADDIYFICEFIARDSLQYAKIFAKDVVQSVKKLEQFPNLERIVPELSNSNIREIILGNYRIIYRLKADFVEILTVYHSARLLDL